MNADPASPHPSIPPRRLRHALRIQAVASVLCGALLLVRFALAGNTRFGGFFGNLLLAWIPLGLSLALLRWGAKPSARWSLAALWLLFFPNAFYLVTDLIHVNKFGTDHVPRWFDQMMTSTYAICGIFLASLSLYLLHHAVTRWRGRRAGWTFALGALGLGAIGMYLGRELRLNSWDIVTRPLKVADKFWALLHFDSLGKMAAFSAVAFAFTLVAYCFVISIAWLHQDDSEA